MEIYEV
jgi:hypothetical protein